MHEALLPAVAGLLCCWIIYGAFIEAGVEGDNKINYKTLNFKGIFLEVRYFLVRFKNQM